MRLEVQAHQDDEHKRQAVVRRATAEPKPGLVYTATRRSAQDYAAALDELGLSAAADQAGLRALERDGVQQLFMDGGLDVVVATSAFGMGIDEADVRFVLHADVADSLDGYSQEAGRAGRDNVPATAVLFYRPEDVALRRFFAPGGADEQALRKVATLGAHAGGAVTPTALAGEMDLSATRLVGLVNLLGQAGAVEVDQGGDDARLWRRWAAAARVAHVEWGEGLVMRHEGNRIVVLFGERGNRTLPLSAVAERDLLITL